jgi:hypothetical protein
VAVDDGCGKTMSGGDRSLRWSPEHDKVHAPGFKVAQRSSAATPRRRGAAGAGSAMVACGAQTTAVSFRQNSREWLGGIEISRGGRERWWWRLVVRLQRSRAVVKQRRIEALLGGSKGCLGSLLDVVREKEKNMARSAQLVPRIKRGAAQGERLEAQRGRRGEVTLARRAQAGETAGGPAQSNSTLFELFK